MGNQEHRGTQSCRILDGISYLLSSLSGSNILATDVGRQIIFLPNVDLWELFAKTVAMLGILLQGSAVCESEKRNSQNRQKNTAARFPPNPRTDYVETDQVSNSTDELHLFAIGSSANAQPIKCKSLIDYTMEVDTGTEVSLISEGTHESLFISIDATSSVQYNSKDIHWGGNASSR